MVPPIFFLHKNFFFFATEFKGAKYWGMSWGKGCTYIKDWLKSFFPLSNLTPLIKVPNTHGRIPPPPPYY